MRAILTTPYDIRPDITRGNGGGYKEGKGVGWDGGIRGVKGQRGKYLITNARGEEQESERGRRKREGIRKGEGTRIMLGDTKGAGL